MIVTGHYRSETRRKTESIGRSRPLSFFTTAVQVSDDTGAAALLGGLPAAAWLIADRGHGADRFRDALKVRGICVGQG